MHLELAKTERIERIVWGRDREGKFGDRVATSYRIEAAREPGAWQLVASSDDREPFKGKERIDWFQEYLRDLWKQATALHELRVPSADAAKRVDMTAHQAHYPAISSPGINPAAMARIYEVIEGRADPPSLGR